MNIKTLQTVNCWKARATCAYCGRYREYCADTEKEAIEGLEDSVSSSDAIFCGDPNSEEHRYYCSSNCYHLKGINIDKISQLPTGTKITLFSSFPVNGWHYHYRLTEVVTLGWNVAIRKIEESNHFNMFSLNRLKDEGVAILKRLQELSE